MSNKLNNKSPEEFTDHMNKNRLPDIYEETAFPLESMGPLAEVTNAIAKQGRVPVSAVAINVLAAVATATQSLNDVKCNNRVFPVSLFALIIMGSGEGKSLVDRIVTKPIRDRQTFLEKQFTKDRVKYENELDAYKKAKKSIISNKDLSEEETTEELNKLVEPISPLKTRLLHSDMTIEGLQKSYINSQPSKGLFNDEGGTFFGGYSMSEDKIKHTIGSLCKFYSGEDQNLTRANEERETTLKNCRLSSSISIQPCFAKDVIQSPLMRAQGYLARTLKVWPSSLMGERFITTNEPMIEDHPAVKDYYSVMKAILKRSMKVKGRENNDEPFTLLPCTEKATVLWTEFYNGIEKKLDPCGSLYDVKEMATRAAEKAARIAAIQALYKEKIQVDSMDMENAIVLVSWFVDEDIRIDNKANVTKESERANTLLHWITRYMEKEGLPEISIDDIQKCGPAFARKSVDKIRVIMNVLVTDGHFDLPENNSRGKPALWRPLIED